MWKKGKAEKDKGTADLKSLKKELEEKKLSSDFETVIGLVIAV